MSDVNIQEKGTEKLLYGIDDINDADELIIVIHITLSFKVLFDILIAFSVHFM